MTGFVCAMFLVTDFVSENQSIKPRVSCLWMSSQTGWLFVTFDASPRNLLNCSRRVRFEMVGRTEGLFGNSAQNCLAAAWFIVSPYVTKQTPLLLKQSSCFLVLPSKDGNTSTRRKRTQLTVVFRVASHISQAHISQLGQWRYACK